MERSRLVSGLSAAVLAISTASARQASIPEVEPNETKAQATAATLNPGDAVTGVTTGFAGTGAPPANWDFFRVRTAGLAPGQIYRHRMVLSSPTSGHTGLLAGLSQVNGVILPTSTVYVQTSSDTTNPARFVQWYGFGLGEQVYFQVRGGSATTGLYTARLVSDPVVPTVIGPFQEGPITVETTPGAGINTELFLYSSSFAPIAMNDDISNVNPINRASRLRLDLAPGVYYLALGRFNSANNRASSGGMEFRNGLVLDFPDALMAEQLGTGQNVSFFVADAVSNRPFAAIQSEPYQVLWYRMDVTSPCDPAAVITAPASVEVCLGRSAAFQVEAVGTPPLLYQWRFNGEDIPGETSDTLTIPVATFAHEGAYDVMVANACGSAISPAAALTVNPGAPEFLQHPLPQTLCIGEIAMFSVEAVGQMNHPLHFQWLKDGQPILGAVLPSFQFTVASLADAGQYSCLVTEHCCGSATSMPALLTVRNEAPVILIEGPIAITLEAGVNQYVEPGAIVGDDCDASVPLIIGGDVVNDRRPGVYTVRYNAVDSQNNAAIEVTRVVLVRDSLKPRVQVAVATRVLPKHNHKLVNVGLAVQALDEGDPQGAAASLRIRVFSNEPETVRCGDDEDRHAPDAKNRAPSTLRLRAERHGRGSGRIYMIVASASDGSGNIGFAFATVVCPLSNNKKDLSKVEAKAAAAVAIVSAGAQTARDLESLMRPLFDKGWSEVGVARSRGPHQ